MTARTAQRVLEAKDVQIEFRLPGGRGAARVSKGVSFSATEGSCLGLFGISGSGKTSLARAIVGIVPDTPGVVGGRVDLTMAHEADPVDLLAGIESDHPYAARYDKRRWRRRQRQVLADVCGSHIGFMGQDAATALNPFATLNDQLMKALTRGGFVGDQHDRDDRARAASAAANLNDQNLAQYPHQLSGGECQRALVAIMMCLNPLVLIADEPTTGLDPTLQCELIHILQDFKMGEWPDRRDDMGRVLLLISHDRNVMRHLADDILVIREGHVDYYGSTDRLLAEDGTTDFSSNLISGLPVVLDEGADAGAKAKPVLALPSTPDPVVIDAAQPILSVRNLTFAYPKKKAGEKSGIEDVGLDIFQREILGLMGESGCGKTTLAKLLVMLLRGYEQGDITAHPPLAIEDTELSELAGLTARESRRRYRRHVQMIFQQPDASLNPGMRVAAIVDEAVRLRSERLPQRPARAARREEVKSWLELLDMGHRMDAYPWMLSGGERRRISILRTLALAPSVIIADEPFDSLDAVLRGQLMALIKRFRDECGTTFVIITHDFGLAESLCDRVAFMHERRIVEECTADECRRREMVEPPSLALAASHRFLRDADPVRRRSE